MNRENDTNNGRPGLQLGVCRYVGQLGLTLLVAFGAIDNVRSEELGKTPNIVFLMADDHRSLALGSRGNEEIMTPNLDQLAKDGISFTRCYATSPLCLASRATVMTGMYEYKTGCNFSTGKLSAADWARSYPILMREAGYLTAFAGKWGFPTEALNYAEQFDKWGGFKGAGQGSFETGKNPSLISYAEKYPHVSKALGAFGRDFIRESTEANKPFCLSLSFKAPHKPHNYVEPETEPYYEEVTFPKSASWGETGLEALPLQAKLGRQYAQRKEWIDAEEYQRHLRVYYQLISGVDLAVGMVLKELEELGIADNTVVIYTSDNGYFCGSHGLQGKVLPYDDAALIPLIVRDPSSASSGQTSGAVVGNIDFAPTMLDYAGLPIPEQMDGKSIRPLIDDSQARVRESLLVIQNWGWARDDHSRALAVATEEHKYIHWCFGDENVPPSEELFDTDNDPEELKNLAANPEAAEVLKKMQSFYDAFHAEWSENCVDSEAYTRHRQIFSRHIPWQEKEFQNTGSKTSAGMKKVYEELTGMAPSGDK
mgnify:CR=1 FL=1